MQPTPPRPQPSEVMEVDPKEQPKEQSAPSAKKEKGTATPASKAPSPKPVRPAKEAPQLPQGSGLISNALFGVDESAKSPDSRSTPNIIVHVPLGKGNQIVNFARLAEEQYGFAALHPRLAAHKARLARVAAAGAALERNDKNTKGISAGESADEDLSLDAERDSDVDGDVAMGGTGVGTNGAPSEASDGKKKRRKKVEEYDRDDPFVDDSEMVWQEQAAASKDGFFVYSGPLVPEGEKIQVERYVLIVYMIAWYGFLQFTGPTVQSSAAVAAAEEQAEVGLRLLILTSPLPLLCLFPRIPACHCADLVPEVVQRAVRAAARKQTVRNTLTVTAPLPPRQMKAAVVAVVVQAALAGVEALALGVEKHLQYRSRCLVLRRLLQRLMLHLPLLLLLPLLLVLLRLLLRLLLLLLLLLLLHRLVLAH